MMALLVVWLVGALSFCGIILAVDYRELRGASMRGRLDLVIQAAAISAAWPWWMGKIFAKNVWRHVAGGR